jgi:hypothetical protein
VAGGGQFSDIHASNVNYLFKTFPEAQNFWEGNPVRVKEISFPGVSQVHGTHDIFRRVTWPL